MDVTASADFFENSIGKSWRNELLFVTLQSKYRFRE